MALAALLSILFSDEASTNGKPVKFGRSCRMERHEIVMRSVFSVNTKGVCKMEVLTTKLFQLEHTQASDVLHPDVRRSGKVTSMHRGCFQKRMI